MASGGSRRRERVVVTTIWDNALVQIVVIISVVLGFLVGIVSFTLWAENRQHKKFCYSIESAAEVKWVEGEGCFVKADKLWFRVKPDDVRMAK